MGHSGVSGSGIMPVTIEGGYVQRGIALVAGAVAAGLLVGEIGLLLIGVIFRYAVNQPLSWVEELAQIGFTWLAMAGAIVAFQRGLMMRVTFVADTVSASTRGHFAALVAVVSLGVFAACAYKSIFYAAGQFDVSTSALELSGALQASALPAGFLVLTVLAALQAKDLPWRDLLVAAGIAIAVAGLIYALRAPLIGIGNASLLFFFVVLLGLCITLSVPIFVTFVLCTGLYIAVMTRLPLTIVVERTSGGMSQVILLSIPLFVFLGRLMDETGMAKAILTLLAMLLGHLRGGLSYVLLASVYLVSGISGSKVADLAAVGPALAPEMKRRGTQPGEIVALLAASGAMSETIPPSIVLITVGVTAGVSISSLFAAGFLPALVMAACLATAVRRRTLKETVAPRTSYRFGDLLRTILFALPGLALPLIVRTSVVEGVATATEVATIAIAYTLVVGSLTYRSVPLRRLFQLLIETTALSGTLLLVVGGASAMAWVLTRAGFSHQLVMLVTTVPGGSVTFMLASIVFFIVVGSLLEGIPAVALFAPLLFPAAIALGLSPIHYAMVVILALGIGLFIPPFGIGYWATCAICNVEAKAGIKPLLPYILALLVGVGLIAAIPWLSTVFV